MEPDQAHAADLLGQLIADYYIEAERWPDLRCALIRYQAGILDAFRTELIQDKHDADDAMQWLDAGRETLALIRLDRITYERPAHAAALRRALKRDTT